MSTTTYYDFSPASGSAFTFEPTLDGTTYSAAVTWNVSGQRYYLVLSTLSGTLVLSIPLIGSPLGYDISLTAGYFTSTLVYRIQNAQIEVTS